MFLTGPDVVKTVTGENVTKEELGGAHMHSSVSGVCHRAFPNDIELLSSTRRLLSYLPNSYSSKRPNKVWTEEDESQQCTTKILNNIVPFDPNIPYDMKNVIESVLDRH